MSLGPGEAAAIATGAALVRGADAVVMLEDTDLEGTELLVRRPAAPGSMVAFAGGDISRGEVVLRPGARIGPHETAVLAALGRASARVGPAAPRRRRRATRRDIGAVRDSAIGRHARSVA